MDLEEFISTTLSQIARGVEAAHKEGSETGFRIDSGGKKGYVKFDVAVTATTTTEGKGGVQVLDCFKAGGGRSSSTENVTRIKFSVRKTRKEEKSA